MDFENLVARGTVIGDGAMGTELQRAGLEIGECGERWVLEHPERIEAIHAAYLAAGSQAIITNSFGANRWVLGRYGLADRVEDVNREAAAIARRAAGVRRPASSATSVRSAGSCAPSATSTPADLEAEFVRQAGALLEGGADGIIIETMSALEEVVAAVRAARRPARRWSPPRWPSTACRTANMRTMMGVSPEQAARAPGSPRAPTSSAPTAARGWARPTSHGWCRLSVRQRRLPVMIQANAGTPELVEGASGLPALAGRVRRWACSKWSPPVPGIVGGCCGTTPAHIAALAAAAQAFDRRERV